MKNVIKNSKEKGIAILIVIASLMLLTTLVVEFIYNTNITYHLAMNEQDRTQAYYLAQSAIQFSRVVLKFDKEARQMVANASQRLGRSIQVQPLYKMIPINSSLLRGLTGGSEPTPDQGNGKNSPPEELSKLQEANQAIGNFDTKKAQDFLAFEGDFDAKIEMEDGKFPLNAFYVYTPTQPEYDRLKNILVNLFLQKPFENLLKDRLQSSKDLVNKIADYVDRNDVTNELGGGERGTESSAYAGLKQKPKNGKLLTVDELILVPGMTEDLLSELKKHVTVYKSTDKINACEGSDEILRAIIMTYTQNSAEPIRYDNEERLKSLVTLVRVRCPDPTGMEQILNQTLGISSPTSQPATASPGSNPAAGVSAPVPISFASMLSSDRTVYRIEATGTVGEAEIKIINVLDTSSGSPDQWKDLYWRVE